MLCLVGLIQSLQREANGVSWAFYTLRHHTVSKTGIILLEQAQLQCHFTIVITNNFDSFNHNAFYYSTYANMLHPQIYYA